MTVLHRNYRPPARDLVARAWPISTFVIVMAVCHREDAPSSSLTSGTGQTKFRFGAIIIRRGAHQPRAANDVGERKPARRLPHGRVFVCIPGNPKRGIALR